MAEHWHGQAVIYDDGTLLQPEVHSCAYQPAPELDVDLLDRTWYHGPVFRAGRWIPGELAVRFWGRDRERVLAATHKRFQAELGR